MGSGIGGFISDLFGSTNKGNKGAYAMEAPKVDPNAYQYGGHPGGADEAANRYRSQAEQAQGRQGEQVNYGQADWDRMQAGYARNAQVGIAGMMADRAAGRVPSIAQMQADRQMRQATAAQASAAASARGPAAMALAQQNAANNTAGMQSGISNQAQINAAQERQQAEQAAFGAFGNIRGGDLQSQQQAAQQAQFQSGLNAQQRQQNDAYDLAKSQMEQGVRNSQLTAGMNQQAQQSSNALGAGQINAGISGQNASMNQQNAYGALGLITNAVGGAAGGPPGKARGGPVEGRKPYLVGEEGPELIVPKHDGTVIPAGPTALILGLGGAAPRATGGPVQAGGEPAWAQSTMMGVAPDYNAQANMAAARENFLRAQSAVTPVPEQNLSGGLAVAGFTPGIKMAKDEPLARRDQETVAKADAYKAQGAELSGRDEYEAQGAEYREEKRKANERGEKKADKRAAPPKGTLATLSDFASKQAGAVDTGYHGGGQIAGPQLLALPARAGGGPVMAGGEPMTTDLGTSGGMSRGMVQAASTGRMGGGMVGGGGVTGGGSVPGGFGGKVGGLISSLGGNLQNLAGQVDTGYHPFVAREEGGPIQAGGEPESDRERWNGQLQSLGAQGALAGQAGRDAHEALGSAETKAALMLANYMNPLGVMYHAAGSLADAARAHQLQQQKKARLHGAHFGDDDPRNEPEVSRPQGIVVTTQPETASQRAPTQQELAQIVQQGRDMQAAGFVAPEGPSPLPQPPPPPMAVAKKPEDEATRASMPMNLVRLMKPAKRSR